MKTIKNIAWFLAILTVSFFGGQYLKQAYYTLTNPPPSYQADTRHHFTNTQHRVVIYTTSWCQYCKKALALLDKKGINYANYDIESDDQYITKNYATFSAKGVPKIVIGDHVINGFFEEEIIAQLTKQSLL